MLQVQDQKEQTEQKEERDLITRKLREGKSMSKKEKGGLQQPYDVIQALYRYFYLRENYDHI